RPGDRERRRATRPSESRRRSLLLGSARTGGGRSQRRSQLRDQVHHEQVRDDVDPDIHGGDDDGDRLDLAHITPEHGRDELAAEPWVTEYRFRDDDAADEILNRKGEHLDAWRETVSDGVAPDDAALAEPVEALRPDEVGAQHFQHADANESGCPG